MKRMTLAAILGLAAALSLAAQAKSPLAGEWRMTYPTDDGYIVAEFILSVKVAGNPPAVSGAMTARACERESIAFAGAGAADERVPFKGSLKGAVAAVSFKIPSCGTSLAGTLSYDKDADRLVWKAKSGSPGPSYVPTGAELYRLDYASAMEEADFYDGQEDFRSALACYYKAAAAKPADVEANYQIATNLGLLALRAEGPEADPEEAAFFDDERACEALAATIALDPSAKERAAKDPSWGPLRRRVRYLAAIEGFDVYDWARLPDLLKAVGTWYEPSMGAGPGREITFKKAGNLLVKNVYDPESGELGDGSGFWEASGETVRIRIIGDDEWEELPVGPNPQFGGDLWGVGNFFDRRLDQGGM